MKYVWKTAFLVGLRTHSLQVQVCKGVVQDIFYSSSTGWNFRAELSTRFRDNAAFEHLMRTLLLYLIRTITIFINYLKVHGYHPE